LFFDAIKLGGDSLGKTSKGFDTVDMGPRPGNRLGLVDADMAVVAQRDQVDIALPCIG